ncbi:aa3-type cytochrome c oxidase subunit IV [Acuticoccus sp. M5D2P5]|uniref:aa3-type cytochrome c oxidase subunit IV n=1 Tax=Acuticoccus kalidii TaxID=2910977 RepID=UPI001F48020B|nr:aa3-type cytochrome c oxidase subunit IV [Acuticoccus kalidii]
MATVAHDTIDSTADAAGDAPRTDFADHQRTYEAFLRLSKWTILLIVLLLFGMLIFLV